MDRINQSSAEACLADKAVGRADRAQLQSRAAIVEYARNNNNINSNNIFNIHNKLDVLLLYIDIICY